MKRKNNGAWYWVMASLALILEACVCSCKASNVPPCQENGPYYGAWTLDSCPYLNNSPSVSPTTFYGNVGDAPCTPTVVPPTYAAGQKERTISYDCSPSTNEIAPITYTVSNVKYDPPLPTEFGSGDYPAFSSDVYVDVTSSDPSLCPSPGRVEISTVLWNIAPLPTSSTVSFNASSFAEFASAFSKIESVAPCVGDLAPSVDAEITKTIKPRYCDCLDGNSLSNEVKLEGAGTIDFGSVTCDVPFAGIPYVASVNLTVNASLSVSYAINATKPACEADTKLCGSISVTGEFGAGISGILGSRKIIYVSGTVQVSVTGSGELCVDTGTGAKSGHGEGCLGSVDLVGKVVLFSGWSHSYKAHLADGYCTTYFSFGNP